MGVKVKVVCGKRPREQSAEPRLTKRSKTLLNSKWRLGGNGGLNGRPIPVKRILSGEGKQRLEEQESDTSSGSPKSICALFMAASENNPSLVKVLIDGSCDVNLVDDRGMSALHHAAASGAVEVVRLLLNYHYNPKFDLVWKPILSHRSTNLITSIATQDYDNMNALMHAAANGHLEAVREIIRPWPERQPPYYGRAMPGYCDITSATSKAHLSAVELAAINGHTDVVSFLVSKCRHEWEGNMGIEGPVSLHNVWLPEIARNLIKMKADVNEKDSYGSSFLEVAILPDVSNVDMVRFLVEEGNISLTGAVTAAAMTTDPRGIHITRYLLEKKADVNEANEEGDTPVIVAARRMHCDVLRLLIESKANVNALNRKGESALSEVDILLLDGYAKSLDLSVVNAAQISHGCSAEAIHILLQANAKVKVGGVQKGFSLIQRIEAAAHIPIQWAGARDERRDSIVKSLKHPFIGLESICDLVFQYDDDLYWCARLRHLLNTNARAKPSHVNVWLSPSVKSSPATSNHDKAPTTWLATSTSTSPGKTTCQSTSTVLGNTSTSRILVSMECTYPKMDIEEPSDI